MSYHQKRSSVWFDTFVKKKLETLINRRETYKHGKKIRITTTLMLQNVGLVKYFKMIYYDMTRVCLKISRLEFETMTHQIWAYALSLTTTVPT